MFVASNVNSFGIADIPLSKHAKTKHPLLNTRTIDGTLELRTKRIGSGHNGASSLLRFRFTVVVVVFVVVVVVAHQILIIVVVVSNVHEIGKLFVDVIVVIIVIRRGIVAVTAIYVVCNKYLKSNQINTHKVKTCVPFVPNRFLDMRRRPLLSHAIQTTNRE
jgi:hypothetical protein